MNRKIRYLGWALTLIFIPFFAQSQESLLDKANTFYENLAYKLAIPKYEQIVRRGGANVEALFRLADCYRLTNNYKKSLAAYAEVIKYPQSEPIQEFFYAQALMEICDYDMAREYLSLYNEDQRGANYIKAIDNINNFYALQSSYSIKKVPFNSAYNDFCPILWKDNSVIFTSSRLRAQIISYKSAWTGNNYDNLYIVKRKKDGTFKKAQRLCPDIQSRYNNGAGCFNKDQTKIYFTRNNIIDKEDICGIDGQVKLKIFEATITNNNKFGDLKEFRYNSKDYNCAHPALSSDGSKLFFASDMPGGQGGMDIWVSYKHGNLWDRPINLGTQINTPGNEVFPYISSGVLYFSSNGLKGLGGLDIFDVNLDDKGMPTGNVHNFGAPVNSPDDDFGITLNPNGKTGYFSSNYKNPKNDDDIYYLKIFSPIKRMITIIGSVTEKQTNSSIYGAAVVLKNNQGEIILQTTSDNNGNFRFETDYNKDYIISGQKQDYIDSDSIAISTKVKEGITKVTANLVMEKMSDLRFFVTIKDINSLIPLKDVQIEIRDLLSGKVYDTVTSKNGEFIIALPGKKIGDKLSYYISLAKDGYVSKKFTYEHLIDQPKDISLIETMGILETGMDLTKLISLKPIYFDVNKNDIRPDAALELDKVVEIMKEYPKMIIELGAHTDCSGSENSNLKLSINRAEATAAYIISKGIEKERIIGKGFGESQLINKCACEGSKVVPCTEEEHQQNRRTEFIIINW